MSPRGRLNRAIVIDTAEDMVDRDGWQQFTLTALAKKLGIQGPSVYNHVEGYDDVLSELQVRAHTDLAQRLQRSAMGRVGGDGVRAMADAFHDFASDHPGLYDLALTEPIEPDRVRAASEPSGAALAAVVGSFGVAEPTPDLFMSCVATFHGVIALGRNRLFSDGVDVGEAYDRAVRIVTEMLEAEAAR